MLFRSASAGLNPSPGAPRPTRRDGDLRIESGTSGASDPTPQSEEADDESDSSDSALGGDRPGGARPGVCITVGDLGEPFDFLTWFEYAPAHADTFEELVGRLRETEEWSYVEHEVAVRLARAPVLRSN